MASTFTWTYDAPSGVYKSHAMSKQLRMAAIADTVFVPYCRKESGFGKKMGDTVTITKIKNMTVPTSTVLEETTRIPIDTFDMDTGSITVYANARGVEYSSLAEDLSEFDLENPIQKKLKDQLALAMDRDAATAFKTTYLCASPTSASGITWGTAGSAGGTAVYNISAAHMGVIRDTMRDTYNVPWYKDSYYMMIASTKALRGIKSDGEFQAWRTYLRPGDVIEKSEVGMIEQFKCVESNNTSALSNSLGTGGVLGGAVCFGDDAVALVNVESPELRAAIPGEFGTVKAVAWYGIYAFGLVWSATATAGEVRVVEIL